MRKTMISTVTLSLLVAESVSSLAWAATAPVPPLAPRCHVVGGPIRRAAARESTGNVMVTVPRLACHTPVPPTVGRSVPQPVRAGSGRGRTAHPSVHKTTPRGVRQHRSGRLPFTGADLARWAAVALASGAGGMVLVLAGRRRAARSNG